MQAETPPSDPTPFRLPGAVVRRTFVLHTAVIVAALAVFHLLTRQQSFAALGGAASLAALVLTVGYASSAGRVWLALSPSGIASVGYTGRKTELSWATAVKVASARKSGYKGHVVAQQGAGAFRSRTSAIFVPAAISASPEFASKVAAWAPLGHPLRSIAKSAD